VLAIHDHDVTDETLLEAGRERKRRELGKVRRSLRGNHRFKAASLQPAQFIPTTGGPEMFRRHSDERPVSTDATAEVTTARGGVLFGPIITGVLVAFGAMFLLSALIAGVIAGLGYADEISSGETFEVGAAGAIALLVAQFLAYMWGGYTAGRMSRGAGLANGVLVPIAAIVVALIVIAVAAVLGATTQLNLPFTDLRLPVEEDLIIDWGPEVGVASLIAMLIGGALGGLMGARWHTKLERATAARVAEERAEAERTDRTDTTMVAPAAPVAPAATHTTTSPTPSHAITAPGNPVGPRQSDQHTSEISLDRPAGTTAGTDTGIRTEDGRPVYVGNETNEERR
jgi:hypothetical protein